MNHGPCKGFQKGGFRESPSGASGGRYVTGYIPLGSGLHSSVGCERGKKMKNLMKSTGSKVLSHLAYLLHWRESLINEAAETEEIMKGRFIIAVLIMAGLILGAPILSHAQAGGKERERNVKKESVERSGKRKMNLRIRREGEHGIEVVKGYIHLIRGSNIVMDGEKFSIARVEIQDEHRGTVGKHELYPGLKAHVVLEYGRVKKVTVYDFKRPRRIEGLENLEREREKMLRRTGK
jgi:hypothetical protein